jgi:hypothetical protein
VQDALLIGAGLPTATERSCGTKSPRPRVVLASTDREAAASVRARDEKWLVSWRGATF